MTNTIVALAEKPSVAQAVAGWLSTTLKLPLKKNSSYIAVGQYRISWLFGHLLENCEPHEYDIALKRWAMADLPFIPSTWKLRPKLDKDGKPDSGVIRQIAAIKELLAEAESVIGLGDPDQEGQLLQDELLIYLKNKKPVNRLWLNATDDSTIAKAWKAMKPNSEYAGYYWSALARSHADYLFGINGTRACTLASQANGGNATLTLGRVQTPVVWLVKELEDRIRAFKPVDYFTPSIQLAGTPAFEATWAPDKDTDTRLDPEGRLLSSKTAQAIVDACKAEGSATVTAVKSTKGSENQPLPFSLSTLQDYMSKRFKMGVQNTLDLAQALYDKKIATYPRTDSNHLPEDQFAEAPDILASLRAAAGLSGALDKVDPKIKSRAWDNKKVSAHHAIVPRPVTAAQLAALSPMEMRVWLEITKRYLIQFFPAATFLLSEIELKSAGEQFRVSGKIFTSRGWKDAFTVEADEDEEDEEKAGTVLPKVAKGDVLPLAAAVYEAKRTKPPKRYNEGSLLTAMKNIHKFVSDPKLRESLRDNAGIGTEATRAATINEVIRRGFITVNSKKELEPSPLADQYIETLPKQVCSPDMTALWQQAMDDIRKTGEAGYREFMKAQEVWLSGVISDIPTWFKGKALIDKSKPKSIETKATKEVCIKCSSSLAHIKGKFGWFFACQSEGCKALFKDVGGKPVERTPPSTEKLVVGDCATGDTCPHCKKGTLKTMVCGPASKAPGKKFLSCSNFSEKGAKKCNHAIWPK